MSVEGTVTLDGNPLRGGQIVFLPTGSHRGPLAGGLIQEGRYSIPKSKGPTVGEHRVEIRPEDPLVTAYRENPDQVDMHRAALSPPEAIPDRYYWNSVLTAVMQPGVLNVLDFELKN